MDKRAGIGNILIDQAVYLILLVLFVIGIFTFLKMQENGASVWGDFYSKEIVKVIDFSKAGDEVWLNVHKATEIARKNNVYFNEIFKIDNVENKVCVKLSKGRSSCYGFFNNVDVFSKIILAGGKNEGKSINLLYLNVSEVKKSG